MEKQLFGEYPEEKRLEMLRDNCEGREELEFMTELTPEELAARKTEFAQVSITEARIEDEKKKANDHFKEQLKPVKEKKSVLLAEIKTGAVEEYGEVFRFLDLDSGMVGYYNYCGQLVSSRPATSKERGQLTITHSIHKQKNGTTD